MSRVKLFTVWSGPLPGWIDQFRERIIANNIADWQLIDLSSSDVGTLATDLVGAPCQKESGYAACDYRPLYGALFDYWIHPAEWWGWIDLDVIVGDLDQLLPPLLDEYDVITTAPDYIHGPLTLMRNIPEVNNLWRKCEYKEVLADPEYWNFDEVGFNPPDRLDRNGNPSLTKLVKESNLRVRWDDRCWTENYDTIFDGLPSRCCQLDGNKLIEEPTGRELLAYHFTSKRWMHNYYGQYTTNLRAYQVKHEWKRRTEPVATITVDADECPAYWAERVNRTLERGEPLYKTSYDMNENDWNLLQSKTSSLISKLGVSGRVLDAGCGHGAVANLLLYGTAYVGADYCSGMVALAKRELRRAKSQVINADIRNLPLETGSFDWAICRGLEGTAKSKLGNREWNRMKFEMLRVAKRVLLIDMGGSWRVVEQ